MLISGSLQTSTNGLLINLFFFVIFQTIIYFLLGAYSERYIKSRYLFYRMLITVLPMSLILSLVSYLAQYPEIIHKTVLVYIFIISIFFFLSRFLIRSIFFYRSEKILIIGSDDVVIEIFEHLINKSKRFKVIEKVDDIESYNSKLENESSDLQDFLFDEVVYSSEIDPDTVFSYFYKPSSLHTRSICDSVSFYERVFSRFPISQDSSKYLVNSIYPMIYSSFAFDKFKRFLDIAISISGLILLFPIFILASCLIYFTSPGPILFRQKRVGFKKQEFEIIKFRTLIHEPNIDGEPSIIIDHDPRITPVGKFLRKYHLDEIPQLWNVLNGNLSIIGPRPIRKLYEDKYEDEIPYYLLRYTAKPGLTGWAQLADIDHRKADGPKLRLQYDLFYIKNRSILFELLIITKTIRYLFLGKGV